MKYYVFRTGWNKANQDIALCPERMRVATVEADLPEEACQLASKRVVVYNNQSLDAEPASESDAEEAEIDSKVKVE